eukprot:6213477-Pleurochrysis_carterae.AAC.1
MTQHCPWVLLEVRDPILSELMCLVYLVSSRSALAGSQRKLPDEICVSVPTNVVSRRGYVLARAHANTRTSSASRRKHSDT